VNPTASLLAPEVQELIRGKLFVELRQTLQGLPAVDVADILIEQTPEDAAIAFRILPQEEAATVFSYLPPDQQEALIKRLGDLTEGGAVSLIEAMEPDDRVRLLDELPPEVANRLIASLSPEERKRTQAILGYPLRSVGRLMTPDYVRIKREWTVGRALEHVRKYGRDAETIDVVYVIEESGLLVDDIRLRSLIVADPNMGIEQLMNRQFVTLRADQDQQEAVLLLARYDRVALPVVDSKGYLLGIVTHDDLADVAETRATEQIQRIGGTSALEEPFMDASVYSLVKKRAPWLALLFMSELLTSNAIAAFETEIQRAAVLATFVPGIISSGGNSGSQASTLVIRALGLREIELSDWWRVLRRELIVAGILGLIIAGIGMFRVSLWGYLGLFPDPNVADHFQILAVTISVTLLGVVTWGSIMGAMLPFLLKKCKLDPAGSSTPFVATLVDVTGIVIYFTTAIFFLKTTLLAERPVEQFVQTSAIVNVVSIDNYDPGDKEVHLTVKVDGDDAAKKVTVPIKGLPGQMPPVAGTELKMIFRSDSAQGAERK
jgi:magnesium transporter